ncbi:hypothetical protein BGZ76_009952 [Entomortierella beljakovae]|nr:hypothetical protein BGZ76_009952 [Entomortierella beljakovae]
MACQMINGAYAGKAGLLRVHVTDYRGLVYPLPIVGTVDFNMQPLHVIKGGQGPDEVWRAQNRKESCGDEYCANLLERPAWPHEDNPDQYQRARVPTTRSGLRGDYGSGWDLLALDAGTQPLVPQLDCDEFPYASSAEGGGDTLINCIMGQENQRHGGELGAFTRRIPRLGPYHLEVVGFPLGLVDTTTVPPRISCPVTCIRGNFGQQHPHLIQVTREIACVV